MTDPQALSADELKRCCAATYQSDLVALVLGGSYHPGGLDLTRHLARTLRLQPGERVLDIASGPGRTACLLASEFGVDVDGVDLAERSVTKANAAAVEKALHGRVRFHQGDAEELPLPDRSVDAVIIECAFCMFPDKPTAAAEITRVLRPGGRIGLTDVTLDPHRLDAELRTLAGWVACLADAQPTDEYARILNAAGLHVTVQEIHDDALLEMIDQIEARLQALRIMRVPALERVDIDVVLEGVALARRTVEDGIAGYSLVVAEKP
jgi:arsenite methyltransferase